MEEHETTKENPKRLARDHRAHVKSLRKEEDNNVTVLHAEIHPVESGEGTLLPNSPKSSAPALNGPSYLLSERILGSIPLWEPIPRKGEKRSVHEKEILREIVYQGDIRKVAVKIYAGGNLGLPNSLDLEFFRAFEQIATDHLNRTGMVANPVRISGHQLLRAAMKAPNGRTQGEVRRFFRKMAGTTIGATRHVSETKTKEVLFHIFEMVVQEGDRRPDGSRASVHEITLAPWYHTSLQSGNCWVVDHALFQRLKKTIAKLLHQLLHSLFYLGHGSARQLYSELVRNWQLSRFPALSRIKQQLDPAHQELLRLGFLQQWSYTPVKDGDDYEIRWEAGGEWWESYKVQRERLGINDDTLIADPFLPEHPIRQLTLPENDDQQVEAMVQDILSFLGPRDRKYEPFWKQAARDIPRAILYRLMGEVREKAAAGAVKNKGSYLVTLIKIEAAKRSLPWANKESKV